MNHNNVLYFPSQKRCQDECFEPCGEENKS